MFYTFLRWALSDLADETFLRVFGYITVRSACALFSAFVLSLVFGPMCIRRLQLLKLGQQVRQFKGKDLEQFNIHQHKAGTPTMGGILIVVSTLVSVLLFCRPDADYVWVAAFAMLGAGLLGFADDYMKVARRDHRGVSAKGKLVAQLAIGLAVGVYLYMASPHTSYTMWFGNAVRIVRGDTYLLVPFLKNLYPFLGILIIPWAALVLTATSNAVNLTDGLDGLAIGTVITVTLPLIVIGYLASRIDYSGYLFIPYVKQAGELVVFLSALMGAAMGFMWFNAHPAQMFMGDTGSLSLGALIGTIALLLKHEVLLVLIGGIFVVEALSVMLQVGFYKWKGQRILLMSPLHNHFVKKGMHESKIIARFLIVSTLLALVGLSTLKLR